MPFVPAICTQCGAKLEVDPVKDCAICSFCGTPFITQNAINKYNITVSSMHADVVNIQSADSADNLFNAGEAYIKMGEFGKAGSTFCKLCEKYPQDYRGWLGQIKAISRNYKYTDIDQNRLKQLTDLYNRAMKIADDKEREEINSRVMPYFSRVMEAINASIEKRKKKTEQNSSEMQDLDNRYTAIRENNRQILEDFEKREEKLRRREQNGVPDIIAAVLFVLLIAAALFVIIALFVGHAKVTEIIFGIIFVVVGVSVLGFVINLIVSPLSALSKKSIEHKESLLYKEKCSYPFWNEMTDALSRKFSLREENETLTEELRTLTDKRDGFARILHNSGINLSR